MNHDTLAALILGAVEGLTEFLPVSSTGHLILVGDALGFENPVGKEYAVVIQLGAILAVVVLSFGRLWQVLVGLPSDPGARRFALAVIVAFLPAAVLGAIFHDCIKRVLFSPWVVVVSLVIGGIAILLIERLHPAPVHDRIENFSPRLSLGIGAFQVLAMIPGVSRSGATIMGALMMGVERKTATLFSFFLAIPTMLGATVYDLYKNRHTLDFDGASVIAVGFVVAFLAALLVVRWLVGFVSRHGFGVFAWYRIALGIVTLGVLFSR